MVNRKRIQIIAHSGVEFSPPPENGMKKNSEIPMMMLATPNFTGVDHWRSPSLDQAAAKTIEKAMMKIGLIELIQAGDISQPKISRSRRMSE